MNLPCRHTLPTLLLFTGAAAASAPATQWEGAIGPLMSLSPEFPGAARHKVGTNLGFFFRYGRFTVSNGGGFVTRRADDVFHGLGLDLVRSEHVRVNFALRLDNGRRSSDSQALTGIGDVRRTIRLRTSGAWQVAEGWKVTSGWNADLLGRGAGNLIDFGVSHDRRLSPRIVWTIGTGLTWADARYMRSYYGVTPAESVTSGYPAYTPGAGLRDVSLGTGFRMEISPRWMALWGGSVGKLVGPTVASPFTTATRLWAINGGLAWRF